MQNYKSILIISSDLRIHEKLRHLDLYKTHHIILLIEDYNDAILEHEHPEQTIVVRDFSDHSMLRAIYGNVLCHNNIAQIVPMDEFSIYVAALIAAWADLPKPAIKQAQLWRDKVEMKAAVKLAGVTVPKSYHASEVSAQNLFPVLIKPRSLAGSAGIVKINDLTKFQEVISTGRLKFDVESFQDMSETQCYIDQYINLPLFNINGVCVNERADFWCISKYIGSQLDHFSGAPLASISVEKKDYLFLGSIIANILRSLHIPNGAFHLELFIGLENDVYFLEIGVRPGGGEIVRTIEYEYGLNLIETHFISQFQKPSIPDVKDESISYAHGWISIPFVLSTQNSIYLKHLDFSTPKELELLRLRVSPAGIDIRRPFYSQERSLATFIFRCPRQNAENLVKEFLDSIQIQGFDDHDKYRD